MGRKGGIKSGEARRKKAAFLRLFNIIDKLPKKDVKKLVETLKKS